MDEMEDFFENDELDREPSPMGDEAIEDNSGEGGTRRVVEPKLLRTKRLANPRLALNERILTGPKGISALRETLKDFKPNPKDDPYANLEKLMKKYAYWGHLMFPKMKTEDVLNRVETLGTRRQVKVFMIKHRLGETGEDSEHEEQENQKNGIIDDGASDNDDDLFKDLPEKEVTTEKAKNSEKSDQKTAEIDENVEEEYRMMEEERLREEQEAKEAADEDALMEDFGDMNNDW
ncbi:Protein TIPIN homolog [Caenorhabditis elegans]|uniref:Protein TIPIN homolog n=1 Tax=Caenorhabditis elegans TaxID=6239 RepID=TIPIN_CAEEL|nr:Protein TIPIN homolog [Caenorhabditis elegans]Q9TXI0.1 RecName: Full=Protein TIPIN homolog; AltName: Full=CSM3 homolog [Caenorhabditis elegans]CCD69893.1 Protein TIPIN homolog [Caenorhabditis elegans]|eukprot:NP_490977.1 Protein TIPIN homolog [Caenorhabditis elegans]